MSPVFGDSGDEKGFIADLVAADLLPGRTDLIDEWLQAALALSIEIFWGETPRSFGNRERLGCLNGSIRRSRGEPSRVHVLRTDGWMTIIRP
ncbi:MAG TPA: hypothetical protein VGB15_11695, partial [Longimicrobium sp.]